jgi:hypothetical protein
MQVERGADVCDRLVLGTPFSDQGSPAGRRFAIASEFGEVELDNEVNPARSSLFSMFITTAPMATAGLKAPPEISATKAAGTLLISIRVPLLPTRNVATSAATKSASFTYEFQGDVGSQRRSIG